MSNSFDPDGLWIKSKLFINRALDANREFEEQAFWACSALELLGKCALAKVSPLLIANPVDDGNSLLVASGLTQGNATSVQAKAIWSRCQRAFKPFSEGEARKLSVGRNEYIHAAGVGFDAVPAHAWWPRYWSQVVILLNHMGLLVDDYVDRSHVALVNAALATRKETVRQQLEARIERSRTMLSQYRTGTLSARQLKEWDLKAQYPTSHHSYTECPACGAEANLYGDEIVDMNVIYGSGDWGEPDVQVTLTVAPVALICDQCRLDLSGYDLLVEAGLDEGFDVEGSADDIDYEPEYNNE
ncbi:hypothetical protein [Microbacterium lacticum]